MEPIENQITVAEETTADILAEAIAPEMPAVTGAIPPTEETPPARADLFPETIPPQPSPPPAANVDDDGVIFSSRWHKIDENGAPLKRRGKFVRVSTGRPTKEEIADIKRVQGSGSGQPSPDSSPKSQLGGVPKSKPRPVAENDGSDTAKPARSVSPEPVSTDYTITAEMYLQTAYGIAEGFFGPDARPENDAEHNQLKTPLVAVLEEKGEIPFTPTQLFLVSLAAYISKKSAKPSIRERAGIYIHRIKSWFKKSE